MVDQVIKETWQKCLSKKIQQKDDGDKQSLVEDEDADANSVSVMRVVSNVTKDVHNSQPWKVPHMIHNNGTGVECQTPSHPKLNVTLSVAVDGYKKISKQAPPFTRRRTERCKLWQIQVARRAVWE